MNVYSLKIKANVFLLPQMYLLKYKIKDFVKFSTALASYLELVYTNKIGF